MRENLDKFNGKFRPEITHETWGHGESGYSLTIFSSHEEAEVLKAYYYLLKLNGQDEYSKRG